MTYAYVSPFHMRLLRRAELLRRLKQAIEAGTYGLGD